MSPELRLEKEREVRHVMDVLTENGYPRACLERWMKVGKTSRSVTNEEKLNTSVCLPYVEGLSEHIRRILRKAGIGAAFKPMSWKWKIMDGVKDKEEKDRKQAWCMKSNAVIVRSVTLVKQAEWPSGAFSGSWACVGRT